MMSSPSRSVPTAGFTRRDVLTLDARRVPPTGHWLRVFRRAMACRFEVVLPGRATGALEPAREALAEAARLEAALSVFLDSSDVTRLNREAGDAPVVVSDELFDLLARCRHLHGATEGAFDVTAGPLSECWGFQHRAARVPAADALARALARVGMSDVLLDPATRSVLFRRQGMRINLGSIGKGYAVQRIARSLDRHGVNEALVSAGGSSVLAIGGGAAGWPIDLAPRAGGPRLRLHLRNAALATSGAGEQYFEVDGRGYGHVLDPRTGRPASGTLSASVVTADAAAADALATAFLVGGLTLARRYCDQHPGTLAIITPDEGRPRPRLVGHCRGGRVEES